jgi:hypothetical protein
MKLSRSTVHRITRPEVMALVLAALRLQLHVPAQPARAPRRVSERLALEAT